MENNFWSGLQLVVFDVDGTLYRQSKLRRIMFFKLIFHYMIRPWKYMDVVILYHFRKEREKRAGMRGPDLYNEQFQWCAEKTGKPVSDIKKVVDDWIFKRPNSFLLKCIYPGVFKFFNDLRLEGIKIGIYSDYESEKKLQYLKLAADVVVSSTDKEVNSFKPQPDGLLLILAELGIVDKNKCLYIGDRIELDGKCAGNCDIPFMLIDEKEGKTDFYTKLSETMRASRNKKTR